MVTADAKGMQAIQMGEWKYIDNTPPEGFPQKRMNQYKNEKPRLYNLKKDRSEQHDLYDKYPEEVKQLRDMLNKIRNTSSTR